MKRVELLFVGLCALAAVRPLVLPARSDVAVGGAPGFLGWSAAPIPRALVPRALQERDRKLAGQFPGELGVFAEGRATWIVRWITQPTRKLHPVADCLRATGYAVTPQPILVTADGAHWGVNTARRGSEGLRVRERIVDARGKEFTDVSAWFWSAVLERSAGPWWSVTRIEPVSAASD